MAALPVSTFIGCTAVYSAELPNATVLANSFLRFHPEAKFAVLIIDGPNDRVDELEAKLGISETTQ